MCATLTQFWRGTRGTTGLAKLGLPSGADKAAWLADHITELAADLDGSCSRAAIDHALACADRRRRAHDPRRATLVHGDVHQWNTLRHPDGREWGVVERVSTGLAATAIGLQPVGAQMLAVADRVAA
jgi:streptomycin 6-kinase